MMNIYYVATRVRYVLVEAEDECNARVVGHSALHELHADLGRLGHEVPIEIRTVRLATTDEIDFMKWHNEMAVGN